MPDMPEPAWLNSLRRSCGAGNDSGSLSNTTRPLRLADSGRIFRNTTTSNTKDKPMAEITAALVKELRDTTGAGMMDCKRALTES